jgi:hypothetical protein
MTQRVLSILPVLGLMVLLPAGAALAQGYGASAMGPHVLPSTYKNPSSQPLPPAVPGARTAEAPAAEATKQATDMSPNDELFDAINRGDLSGARDALNRGAILSATNVLGMTPLDLSVDLARDDITTLLLSMRGSDSGPTGPTATAANTAGQKGSQKATQAAFGRPTPANPAQHPRAVVKLQEVARVSPSQQAYGQNPGTPDPAAGFLGFGQH